MTVSEDFTGLTGRFRGELLAHCYRMLGSAADAEDLVQETYLRAWRAYEGFEGRSSVRTWLYRIATNACLTAIERRGRRPLPSGLGGPVEDADAPMVAQPEVPWLQPFPSALLAGEHDDLAAVAASRAGVRLAFVAALQYLSARQRARAQLAHALPAQDELAEPAEPDRRALLDRFAAAIENADASAMAELLREDVALEMPPLLTWFTGQQSVARFIGSRVFARFGEIRMVPVMANGQPAFAGYTRGDDGSYHAHEIVVPTVTKTGIARIVVFLNPDLFAMFGLPHDYDPAGAGPTPA